jgi:hypothetical protein
MYVRELIAPSQGSWRWLQKSLNEAIQSSTEHVLTTSGVSREVKPYNAGIYDYKQQHTDKGD